jgi:hypothetical protein
MTRENRVRRNGCYIISDRGEHPEWNAEMVLPYRTGEWAQQETATEKKKTR